MSNPNQDDSELSLTAADINRAADEGIVTAQDANNLIQWGYQQRFNKQLLPQPELPRVEQRKGFNPVTVAYYFGAMLMISACGWFLGSKWQELGSSGIFITTLIYLTVTVMLGGWLRKRDYPVAGGLLITVGVCLVPLITYCVEDMLKLWPQENPGGYQNYYPYINGSWIVMELATIAAAIIALRYVRFAFLTAPMAFSFWFFSMDLADLLLRNSESDWQMRKWISVMVGAITIIIGYFLDRKFHREGEPRSEDFAYWSYLFGMLAFWGGLTAMDSGSELMRLLYALFNVGLIGLSLKLKRAVFLVFGALGVHLYLGQLAYGIFRDSFFFPFALALLGLNLILVTVWLQKRFKQAVANKQTVEI